MQVQATKKREPSPKRVETGIGVFLEALSPSMRVVEALSLHLSRIPVPVLILGEVGVGKRTIARRIHEVSACREREFGLVDCRTVSAEIFERQCAIVACQSGTVLFDEIAHLDSACQCTLLNWMEAREAEDDRESARLLFSSSRDLESEMRAGNFNEDLYFRIAGASLHLPPLRQRKRDIPSLMEFFLGKFATEFSCPVPLLSEDTRTLFGDYVWPGNVRELRDAARAIVALGDESVAMHGLRAMLLKSDRYHPASKLSLKEAGRSASRETEKELILNALARTRWNRRRAAQELKISYKSLLYKLKQMGNGDLKAS